MDRGALDVDWIISLGIFMIFLSFFFFYLQPFLTNTPDESNTLLFDVGEEIIDNTSWSVQRIPVIVRGNVSGDEIIVTDFSLNWNNMAFADNSSFLRLGNRLVYEAELSREDLHWIVSSSESYPASIVETQLVASESGITNDASRLQADLNGVVENVNYRGIHIVRDVDIFVNSIALINPVETFSAASAIAGYQATFEPLNHTTFVVDDHEKLINFIDPAQNISELRITYELSNLTTYYLDGETDSLDECVQSTTNYLDVRDELVGVSFITHNPTNISICPGAEGTEVSLTWQPGAVARYDVVFHTDTEDETLGLVNPYNANLGLSENLTGLKLGLFQRLNQSSYTPLKTQLGIPFDKNYNFELSYVNESDRIVYGRTPPTTATVVVREFNVQVLDAYGNQERNVIRVRTW